MTTHDTEVRWPKRWSCSEARSNEFAEQSGPGEQIMAVRNGVTIGTADLCPKCYETFGHHAARPDQPPFAPGQTVRDTRTGKQHNVARCEKRVVYGTLRWIVDDHNGSRAFADDCVLVHIGTLTTETVAALVAETEHCFKPLEPSPVRYACLKLAAVGDTVKVIGSNPPLHMKVEEVSPTGGLYIKSPTGAWCMLLNSSQVEFVPEVTIAHPVCRGCNQPLKAENAWMSDGCPCNNPRGINHGLVPKEVCTCDECAETDHIVDANKMIEPATDFDFAKAANKAAMVIKTRLDSDTLTVSADMLSDAISAQIRPGVQELYKKLQHRRCDTCGANTIDGCTRCGAPQCCPQCCIISTHEHNATILKERLAVAMSLLGQADNRLFLVGKLELRRKQSGWSVFDPVANMFDDERYGDPIAAYQRAKAMLAAFGQEGGVA